MTGVFVRPRDFSDPLSERFHGAEGRLETQTPGWKGPDVAERHGAKTPSNGTRGGPYVTLHVQNRRPINLHAA